MNAPRPRQHMVTHLPGARYGHATGGPSAHQIATGLRSYALANWATGTLGHVGSAWVPTPPSTSTPERKLGHLIDLCDQHLQTISGRLWRLRLDDSDCPRAIILTRRGSVVETILVRWDLRLLKLDGAIFSLATPEVGQALMASIASRVGARLGVC